MKKIIKILLRRIISFLRKVPGGEYAFEIIVNLTINQSYEINHKEHS